MHRLAIAIILAVQLTPLMLFCPIGFADHGEALMKAASDGDSKQVRELFKEGADVNATHPLGRTALMGAAKNGHLEVARLLLKKDADVNARTWDGKTALICAQRTGHKGIEALLKAHGAKQ